jgi:hypothetical protein
MMEGRPPIGAHFFIFYYTGLIPYHIFVHTSSAMSHAITSKRKHHRQQSDVKDRFQEGPAIAEFRVAEPGAGLADDQGVDDAALIAQPLGETR